MIKCTTSSYERHAKLLATIQRKKKKKAPLKAHCTLGQYFATGALTPGTHIDPENKLQFPAKQDAECPAMLGEKKKRNSTQHYISVVAPSLTGLVGVSMVVFPMVMK